MFFFKQNMAYEMRISDWLSDVCSSDLDPGGSAPQDGRIRLPALLPANDAARFRILRAAGLRAFRRRRDLYLAGCAGPGGHEKADRLFLGRARSEESR